MTPDELYNFNGGLLVSGYAIYPDKKMFWASFPIVPENLHNTVRLTRLEQFLRHLHLNDDSNFNTEDILLQLRPAITHLNELFRAHGG